MFVATMSRSTLACPWFGSIANTYDMGYLAIAECNREAQSASV
jgi:hypothetical protein